MYCVNVSKVRGKMAERGYTITSLADYVGVNRNTMSSYLENPSRIPYDVLDTLADALCDSWDEAAGIFFADSLRKT